MGVWDSFWNGSSYPTSGTQALCIPLPWVRAGSTDLLLLDKIKSNVISRIRLQKTDFHLVSTLWHFSFACSDKANCLVDRPTWQGTEGASVQQPTVDRILSAAIQWVGRWMLPSLSETDNSGPNLTSDCSLWETLNQRTQLRTWIPGFLMRRNCEIINVILNYSI